MEPDQQTEISDEELALHAQGGSLSHFEELVYRYEARVSRFLLKCCRSETDARDLTQVTFVAAYQHIDQFDTRRPFAGWLFAIARRKFLDHCRQCRMQSNEVPEGCDDVDPFVLLDRSEQESRVWDWARRLVSPDQFQALWLRYQEDLPIKEIARALGRTQISVKILLFRARKKLADVYERNPQGLRDSFGGRAPVVALAIAKKQIPAKSQ